MHKSTKQNTHQHAITFVFHSNPRRTHGSLARTNLKHLGRLALDETHDVADLHVRLGVRHGAQLVDNRLEPRLEALDAPRHERDLHAHALVLVQVLTKGFALQCVLDALFDAHARQANGGNGNV